MTNPSNATETMIDTAAIGVEVSWSFGDGSSDAVTLPRAEVIAAFQANGFEIHAPESTLEIAEVLRRVRRCGTNVQRMAVRELARPNKDTPVCVGVYIRLGALGTASEVGDGWSLIARVRQSDTGGVVCLPPEGALGFDRTDALSQEAAAEGHRLAELANSLIDNVHNGDLSRALVSAAQSCTCIARRPGGGGVYLLMRNDRAERFMRLLRDLASLTRESRRTERFVYQAQETYARPLTIASWADSAETQIAAEAHRLLGDLESLVSRGVMREKTMIARGREADEACQLAEAARVFLGAKADELQAMLTRVKLGFEKASNDDMTAAKAALAAFPDSDRKARFAAGAPEEAPAAVEPAPEVKRGRNKLSIEQLFAL